MKKFPEIISLDKIFEKYYCYLKDKNTKKYSSKYLECFEYINEYYNRKEQKKYLVHLKRRLIFWKMLKEI